MNYFHKFMKTNKLTIFKSTSMEKKLIFISILLFLSGCYTYKPLPTYENDFVVGQKYEIRIGNRPMERVFVNSVTDSTLVVRKGRTELVVQRDMVTESKFRKFSPGKTVLGIVVGGFLTYSIASIVIWL